MSCLIIWCKSNKKVIVTQTFLLLSLSRGCSCLRCTNKANSANYRRVWHPAIPSYENSHRLHRYTQIRRVWHPCHTHAANQTIFPQNPTQPNYLCASVCIRGRLFSAKSFCVFCEFCGRLFSARSFCEFREFRGRLFSARSFCEFREFRGRTLRSLTSYEHL